MPFLCAERFEKNVSRWAKNLPLNKKRVEVTAVLRDLYEPIAPALDAD
jgi:hypothetical protein